MGRLGGYLSGSRHVIVYHMIVPALPPLGFCLIWWDESEEGPKWGLKETNMNNQPACKSQEGDGNALNCHGERQEEKDK
jgi:hypothetical protein